MIDLVWCDGCSRLWTRSSLKADMEGLHCPECNRELPTYRMAIHECSQCHRKILCIPEYAGKVICDCEREEEEQRFTKMTGGDDKMVEPELETKPAESANGQESDEPAVANISWQSSSDEEIACAPSRGKKIRYQDTLTLENQQAACFFCGGKRLWVRGPAVRILGFDSRDPEEILLAHQCGEETGLPLMINTSIVIYDLRKRAGLTGEPKAPLKLAGKIGFLPVFRFNLAIDRPKKLCAVSFENEVPSLSELKGHVIFQLTKGLAERVEHYAADSATLPEAGNAVQEHLEVCLAEMLMENPPGGDWGLKVDEVQLSSCKYYFHFCPVCHLPIENKAEVCRNGHVLRWCPVCGEIQNHGVCANGHEFQLCRLCGREVLLNAGKCPRHGSLGFNS